MEDIEVAKCLRSAGVYIGRSTDENNLDLFHPLSLSAHFLGAFPSWLDTYAENPLTHVSDRGRLLRTVQQPLRLVLQLLQRPEHLLSLHETAGYLSAGFFAVRFAERSANESRQENCCIRFPLNDVSDEALDLFARTQQIPVRSVELHSQIH